MKRLGIIFLALVLIVTATGFIIKNQEPVINQANFKIANEKISLTTVKYKDENYIKLRDFASICKDRLFDFSLVYKDGKILIDTSKVYDELKDIVYPLEDIKGYKIGKTDIYVDGDKHNLSGINIKDYNYFRLRDLGEIFKVDVSWEQETKEITLSKKGGEDLNREKIVSFRQATDYSPLGYAGYETKILADGSLQIIYAVKANTGGYSLSTKEVKISDGTIYITPDLRGPGPNQMVTQVISYPTTSIIIDKKNLPEKYTIEIEGSNSELVDR
ncbi:protease complex subunit PrcB family protein [Neofamilia massiliensis]|uniref:protease complex subunit PrcB family protein n=1 Tax=Neofamilia massiliensis TaxID=1673724 RepID=UPI0006BB6D3D|nr:protease complex subunit PrcB family protein [Neofamilia massiliensis]